MTECLNHGLGQASLRWTRSRAGGLSATASGYLQELEKAIQGIEHKDRLTSTQKQLREAVRIIKSKGWIIKESDKNLGLVMMSKEIYNDLLSSELDDDSFVTVDGFPHNTILQRILKICRRSNLNHRATELIMKEASRFEEPSCFYVIPKIHKATLKARPITAQHSYVFSHLSRKLSDILNKVIHKIPAISINSKQVVRELERMRLPPVLFFLTYDVERMYPSMNIMDTIVTLRNAFPHIFKADGCFWFHILALILQNNYITARGETKRQIKGIATGSAVATAIANLYLFIKYRPVFNKHARGIIMNRRFVDDGLVFARTKEAARALAEDLNDASDLNITWQISSSEAVYLDLRIYIGTRFCLENKVDIEIYTKPISKHLYLHASSTHPRYIFTGIVKGELIRYLRNTSSQEVWVRKAKFLFGKLKQRGYSDTILHEAFDKIHFKDRNKYVFGKPPLKKPIEPFIVAPYNPHLRRSWRGLVKLLEAKVEDTKVTRNFPRQVVFTRNRTIRNTLISAKHS